MVDSNAVHIYLTLVSSAALLDEVPPELEKALSRAWKKMTEHERRQALQHLRIPLTPTEHPPPPEAATQGLPRRPPKLRLVRSED